MGVHHFAIATKNFEMAHHFYTEVMGFPLVAGVKRQAPGGGWTKHMFYDIGDGGPDGAVGSARHRGRQDPIWRSPISTGLACRAGSITSRSTVRAARRNCSSASATGSTMAIMCR